MQPTLRPDQQAVKAGVYDAWNNGARHVLAIACTGWGKSVVMSDISLDIERNGQRQCIIAHRRELVGQMAMHIARRGIKHRIIGPKDVVADIAREQRAELGKSFVNPDARAAVAGIDTINSRSDELREWAASVDYWFGDEGHHYLRNNKWGQGIDLFTRARGLLVTACPERADGCGLGSHMDGYADTMILGPTMRETIALGGITDYEIVVPVSDFHIDENARGKDGDFTRAKMRDATKKSHLVGDVVTEYSRHAFGKRAICFATDVEPANDIAAKFNEAGIPAVALNGNTPSNVRREMLNRFKLGTIWVLVNVDLFDEGYDCPSVEIVIMARPTASLNKYLQIIGRGLRVLPGKQYGLIIDHVSNWKRHGLPDKPRQWSLDRREKRAKREPDPEEIDLTSCRGCNRPYERFHAVCPYCGFEPPLPDPASRTLLQVDGDLTRLTVEMLAAMRADTVLETPASVAERVALAAGPVAAKGQANRAMEKHAAQARLWAALEAWGTMQRAKGRSESEIYRRFYLATGMTALDMMHRDRSRADYEASAVMVEGWCGIEPPSNESQKKTPEELIQQAIDEGLQGFRGGWIDVGAVSELCNIHTTNNSKASFLIKNMGYHKIGTINKTVGGLKHRITVYHKDPNAKPEVFWKDNDYVDQFERQIQQAIDEGLEGFRGGWVESNAANRLIGNHLSLATTLTGMGYSSKKIAKLLNGKKIFKTVYHKDPDADLKDFWKDNGYE